MRRLILIAAAFAVAATAVNAAVGSGSQPSLASKLASARLATAKYATDLGRAKADGYNIITPMIPSMGYHFMNPKVTGFDVTKPAILVYVHRGSKWQLGALEWVFAKKPAKPPIEGAKYGTFAAACHYVDGTFVPANSQDECAAESPTTGSKFSFWHRRSSRCTSGCGTRTRPACTRA